ncbi:MAG: dTMP kinase [Armatimonadota bacterium]
MTKSIYYGAGMPYLDITELSGKLIVIEGPDGVGRSTQVGLLRQKLEERGYGVIDTAMSRSALTQAGIEQAKQGNLVPPLALSLFYAADFADRLENQIIPALKAGFCVLADRYFYSIAARNIVRGAQSDYSLDVYGFALKPDVVFYLRTDVETLVARQIYGRGLNYWESGMDLNLASDLYDSFKAYQQLMLEQFDIMAASYGFEVIDATHDAGTVHGEIMAKLDLILEG